MTFVGCGVLISFNPLRCVWITNPEYEVRPAIVNINSKEPLFYPYNVYLNICRGSCKWLQ